MRLVPSPIDSGGMTSGQRTMTFLTEDWLFIDGTMDNAASNAMDSYDKKAHVRANRVREKGWEQIPEWPKPVEGFATWPAPGQTSALTMTIDEWGFIAASLDAGAETYDLLAALPHMADPDEWVEEATTSRRLASQIREGLTE